MPTLTDETTAQSRMASETTHSSFSDMSRNIKDDFAAMLRLKGELLKEEMKESASGYIKDSIFMVVAGALLIFAIAFLDTTIMYLVSQLFPFSVPVNFGLGALVVTLLNALAGIILFMVAKKRMAKRSVVPHRSIHEIERDKQWLTNEIH